MKKNESLQTGGFALALLLSLNLALGPIAARAADANKPPVVSHDPVTYSIKGQSLTLKARVTDAAPGVQDVTLYYALFRDAAPFRVPMKPAGLDAYIGTIDANMIKDRETIAYYIEAQDKDGAIAETTWYTVEFRKGEETPVANTGNGGNVVTPGTGNGNANTEDSGWSTAGWVAAGVAVVGLGALALGGGGGGSSSSGGGGGGGGGGTNNPAAAGTYQGSATLCLTASGQGTSCDANNFTLVIDNKGVVFSDTLLPGTSLSGSLNGNKFILTGAAPVQGTVTNGTINYNGTLVGTEIVGSINGSAKTTTGPGSWSGNFNANKN